MEGLEPPIIRLPMPATSPCGSHLVIPPSDYSAVCVFTCDYRKHFILTICQRPFINISSKHNACDLLNNFHHFDFDKILVQMIFYNILLVNVLFHTKYKME